MLQAYQGFYEHSCWIGVSSPFDIKFGLIHDIVVGVITGVEKRQIPLHVRKLLSLKLVRTSFIWYLCWSFMLDVF